MIEERAYPFKGFHVTIAVNAESDQETVDRFLCQIEKALYQAVPTLSEREKAQPRPCGCPDGNAP